MSRNAESTAVSSDNIQNIRIGLPPVTFIALTARYWKRPLFERMPTTIIMPTSSPTVLWSIALTASSDESSPLATMTDAPNKEAVAVFILPLAARIITPRKMASAAQACIVIYLTSKENGESTEMFIFLTKTVSSLFAKRMGIYALALKITTHKVESRYIAIMWNICETE